MIDNPLENAKRVVEELLQVSSLIEQYKDQIYRKLEDLDKNVTNQSGGDIAFMAGGLSLISGIVHVGSTLKDYDRATDWVKQQLAKSDPGPVLSALTFIYIVDKGFNEFKASSDEDKRDVWERIHKRVESELKP